MKRFAIILCLFLSASFLHALDNTVIVTERVTGGSNSYMTRDHSNWNLMSVAFTLPSAITNTFAITHVRPCVEDTATSIVTTNGFGDLETNTWGIVLHTTYYVTNTLFSVTTTNNTSSQVYDSDDLPKDFPNAYGDELTFTFTETNAVFLLFSGR